MKTITKCYRLTPIDVDRIRAIRLMYAELSLNETDVIKLAIEQLFQNGLDMSAEKEDKYYIVFDGQILCLLSGYDISIMPSSFYNSDFLEVLTLSELLEKYPEEVDFSDLSCAEAHINTKE